MTRTRWERSGAVGGVVVLLICRPAQCDASVVVRVRPTCDVFFVCCFGACIWGAAGEARSGCGGCGTAVSSRITLGPKAGHVVLPGRTYLRTIDAETYRFSSLNAIVFLPSVLARHLWTLVTSGPPTRRLCRRIPAGVMLLLYCCIGMLKSCCGAGILLLLCCCGAVGLYCCVYGCTVMLLY